MTQNFVPSQNNFQMFGVIKTLAFRNLDKILNMSTALKWTKTETED